MFLYRARIKGNGNKGSELVKRKIVYYRGEEEGKEAVRGMRKDGRGH